VILSTPLLLAMWTRLAKRRREPDSMTKIAIGMGLVTLAYLMLAFVTRSGVHIHFGWCVLFSAIMGVAFVHQWPTTLALISQYAPARLNSTMMGAAFLSLFLSYTIIGWIGGFYERIPLPSFWLIHAALTTAGGIIVLLTRKILMRSFQKR
jgi:POT family proton-dependent oligopeptide transporter